MSLNKILKVALVTVAAMWAANQLSANNVQAARLFRGAGITGTVQGSNSNPGVIYA